MHTASIIILAAIGITRAPIRLAVGVVARICDHDYDVGTAVRTAVVGIRAGCLERVAGAAGLNGGKGGVSVFRWLFGDRHGGVGIDLFKGG